LKKHLLKKRKKKINFLKKNNKFINIKYLVLINFN